VAYDTVVTADAPSTDPFSHLETCSPPSSVTPSQVPVLLPAPSAGGGLHSAAALAAPSGVAAPCCDGPQSRRPRT